MGILQELRAKKLVQWSAAYVAGAAGLLGFLALVSEPWGWSPRVQQGAQLVALVGLPVAILAAWFHGAAGRQEVRRSEVALMIVAVLVGGGVLVAWWSASPDVEDVVERPTNSPEALAAFVEGSRLVELRSPASLPSAIDSLERAVGYDPEFAEAWTTLAVGLLMSGRYQAGDNRPRLARADAAARRAVELDASSAEAWVARARVEIARNFAWDEAELLLRRAQEADPRSAEAHRWRAVLLESQGRAAEAMAEAETALQLQSTSPDQRHGVGVRLYMSGQFGRARDWYGALLAASPDYPLAHEMLGLIQVQLGDFGAARESWRRWAEISGVPSPLADTLVNRIELSQTSGTAQGLPDWYFEQIPLHPVYRAIVLTLVGDRDAAVEWLEFGLANRSPDMHSVGVRPEFSVLRSDPRFRAILDEVGLS